MSWDLAVALLSIFGVFITLVSITWVSNNLKALRSSCIRRDDLQREPSRLCCPVSCFGYIFDLRAFKENSTQQEIERGIRPDPEEEQLQSYYVAVTVERQLQETVNSGFNVNSRTLEQFQRARVRRTILAARTREVRLRRREERIAHRQQHEPDAPSRFSHGLNQDEKQNVLDVILSYPLYEEQQQNTLVHGQTEDKAEDQQTLLKTDSRIVDVKNLSESGSLEGTKLSNWKNESCSVEEANSRSLPSGCNEESPEDQGKDEQTIRHTNSRVVDIEDPSESRSMQDAKKSNLKNESFDEKSHSFVEEEDDARTLPSGCSETSDSENSDSESQGGNCEEVCAFCLDEFVEGDVLAGRPERCPHTFHKSCLSSWLERQEFCPICRCSILSEKEWKDTHLSLVQNQSDK
mmetsp:Transcript_12014/g.18439  ORF Transcript_12014/g.18439 Transcript_12014/m.18439 type:complete len:406 (-) Transcript_12014:119-1336(-)